MSARRVFPLSVQLPFQQMFRILEEGQQPSISLVFPKDQLTMTQQKQIYQFAQLTQKNYKMDENNESININYQQSTWWQNVGIKRNQDEAIRIFSKLIQIYSVYLNYNLRPDFNLDHIFTYQNNIYVLDFGLEFSVYVNDLIRKDPAIYSPYFAPEIKHGQYFKDTSPSWSFGVLLLNLLSQKQIKNQLTTIIQQNNQILLNEFIKTITNSKPLLELLFSLLQLNPTSRIKWFQIKDIPIINQYYNILHLVKLSSRKSTQLNTPTSISPIKFNYKSEQPNKIIKLKLNPQNEHQKKIINTFRNMQISNIQTKTTSQQSSEQVSQNISQIELAKKKIKANVRMSQSVFFQMKYKSQNAKTQTNNILDDNQTSDSGVAESQFIQNSHKLLEKKNIESIKKEQDTSTPQRKDSPSMSPITIKEPFMKQQDEPPQPQQQEISRPPPIQKNFFDEQPPPPIKFMNHQMSFKNEIDELDNIPIDNNNNIQRSQTYVVKKQSSKNKIELQIDFEKVDKSTNKGKVLVKQLLDEQNQKEEEEQKQTNQRNQEAQFQVYTDLYKKLLKKINFIGKTVAVSIDVMQANKNVWIVPLSLIFKRMCQLRSQAINDLLQKNNVLNLHYFIQFKESQQYNTLLAEVQKEQKLILTELEHIINAAKKRLEKLDKNARQKMEAQIDLDLNDDIRDPAFIYFYNQILRNARATRGSKQISNLDFKKFELRIIISLMIMQNNLYDDKFDQNQIENQLQGENEKELQYLIDQYEEEIQVFKREIEETGYKF